MKMPSIEKLAMMAEPWNYPVSNLPHGKATVVSDLIRNWLNSDRYRNLSRRTKMNYISCVRNIEMIQLGDSGPLDRYHAHKISYAIADCVKAIFLQTMKPGTVQLHFSVLCSVWEYGIRCGNITINPWASSRIKVNNIRDVVWTRDDVEIAVDFCRKIGYNLLALYILLGYHTGQRPWSDLRELKWDNVVEHGDLLVLDFTIAKTKQHMRLPLSDEATEVVRALEKNSEYVFVNEAGHRYSPTYIGQQFRKIKQLSGLPANLMLRDLRRTAVTEMAMAGATSSEITACTGWKSAERIINRYAVVRQRTAQNAVNKRQSMFNEESISDSIRVLQKS